MSNEVFSENSYLIKKKVFKLFGESFRIYNQQGQLNFFVQQKAFKLKEDIRVYTGEDMKEEVLIIKARSAMDFSAIYDVYDSKTNENLGSLKRKGLKSMLKDSWTIFDADDKEIVDIQEDSMALSLLRKFVLGGLLPQTFIGRKGEEDIFTFKQKFNLFVPNMNLDFSIDKNNVLDRRVGIAAAVLLCAIEGKQN